MRAGSVLLLLREDEEDYYKVAFGGRPVFIPKSSAARAGAEKAAFGLRRAAGRTQFMLGFFGVIVSSLFASVAVGLLWQKAGLVLGLVYLALYLACVVSFGLRRTWFGLGLLAAAPIAAPMFVGMAFLTWFGNYYEP